MESKISQEILKTKGVFLSTSLRHTVDGRNPAPVEVGSLSQCLQGFTHPRWCRISSIDSMELEVEGCYMSGSQNTNSKFINIQTR